MKLKILNLLLAITSLLGYLEWSGGSQSFLFQIEAEVLRKLVTDPLSVVHPLILLPFLGQVMLLITLFQKKPSKLLTYIGIGGLFVLLGFMLFVGLISMNLKIIVSTIPFITLAVITFIHIRKIKNQ